MRSIVATIFTCGLLLSLLSVTHRDPGIDLVNQFCARMKDGKIEVVHQGKAIVNEVMLANGTKVKPDGAVVTSAGRRKKLKDGECIDKEGNILNRAGALKNLKE